MIDDLEMEPFQPGPGKIQLDVHWEDIYVSDSEDLIELMELLSFTGIYSGQIHMDSVELEKVEQVINEFEIATQHLHPISFIAVHLRVMESFVNLLVDKWHFYKLLDEIDQIKKRSKRGESFQGQFNLQENSGRNGFKTGNSAEITQLLERFQFSTDDHFGLGLFRMLKISLSKFKANMIEKSPEGLAKLKELEKDFTRKKLHLRTRKLAFLTTHNYLVKHQLLISEKGGENLSKQIKFISELFQTTGFLNEDDFQTDLEQIVRNDLNLNRW
jgi:hypothetical protein